MSDPASNVKAVAFIAIALGAIGLMAGAMGVVGLAFPKVSVAPNADPKVAALNEEFQRRILETQKDLRPLQMIVIPILLLASTSLLVAGIGGLRERRLQFFQVTLLANAVTEILGGTLGMIAQFRTMGVTSWYFRETAAASSLPPAVSAAMRFAATSGIGMSVIWLVGKVGFYIWGAVQLRKPASPDPDPLRSSRPA